MINSKSGNPVTEFLQVDTFSRWKFYSLSLILHNFISEILFTFTAANYGGVGRLQVREWGFNSIYARRKLFIWCHLRGRTGRGNLFCHAYFQRFWQSIDKYSSCLLILTRYLLPGLYLYNVPLHSSYRCYMENVYSNFKRIKIWHLFQSTVNILIHITTTEMGFLMILYLKSLVQTQIITKIENYWTSIQSICSYVRICQLRPS